jgi:hypothetical protein
MSDTPMKRLVNLPLGLQVFWASPWSKAARFSYPGVHVWVPMLKRHFRIVPLPGMFGP